MWIKWLNKRESKDRTIFFRTSLQFITRVFPSATVVLSTEEFKLFYITAFNIVSDSSHFYSFRFYPKRLTVFALQIRSDIYCSLEKDSRDWKIFRLFQSRLIQSEFPRLKIGFFLQIGC